MNFSSFNYPNSTVSKQKINIVDKLDKIVKAKVPYLEHKVNVIARYEVR